MVCTGAGVPSTGRGGRAVPTGRCWAAGLAVCGAALVGPAAGVVGAGRAACCGGRLLGGALLGGQLADLGLGGLELLLDGGPLLGEVGGL